MTPNTPDAGRAVYPCGECGVLWATAVGAYKCCLPVHRGGQDAYSDSLGRAGVQCHGGQLYRLRRLIRRGPFGEVAQ